MKKKDIEAILEALSGDEETGTKTDEEILKEIRTKEDRAKRRVRRRYQDVETSAIVELFRRAVVIHAQHLQAGEGSKARKAQEEVMGIAYELHERNGLFGLAKFLRDGDEHVRVMAAYYVHDFMPDEAKKALQILSGSEELYIRINAGNALDEWFGIPGRNSDEA